MDPHVEVEAGAAADRSPEQPVAAVTPGYVFGASPTRSRRALLVCWYATTWLAGLGVIALFSAADVPRMAVVVGTVCVTAPLNFLGGFLLVGRR